MYLEQGEQRTATLMFTGGDAGSKTATVTSLPSEGSLYQYDGGALGTQITTIPTAITDASFKVIYVADGNFGNGAGNFDFNFSDATGTSADATYSINVSPPGIPNFMFAAKESDRVEITFDRNMTDPTGKHLEFAVQDNGIGVTSTSCNLKAGDPTTIVVYTSPGLNTDNTITVAYTKGTVTAQSGGELESFDFQLAGKMAQVINFDALTDKTYGDPNFSLSASASSGLSVVYSSSNSTVISVSGSTASVINAGATLINAFQAGDATYAEVNYQRTQTVNKATAAISITNTEQEYTGSGIAVTTSTTPGSLTTKVEYNGALALPINLGSYSVDAEIEDNNYQGSASATLTISDHTAPAPDISSLPTITEECSATATAPTATDIHDGTVTATTSTSFPVSESTTVTWTYTDASGNSVNQTQEIIIDDATAPVTPTLADINGECSVTAVAPTTTD
ncbi:MAG: hypothetical protein JXP36_03205, partial [Bacteroidales bacterium]|nr:hypothetical protein [Bacteroidales bacterium]